MSNGYASRVVLAGDVGTIVARAVNLIAAGLLTGNELGSLLNVHPAFDDLDLPTRVRAKQAITKRYGRTMPFIMSGTIVSSLSVLWVTKQQRPAPLHLSAGGMGCFVAMLATTLAGNIPINTELLWLDAATTTQPAFDDPRSRWTRLHRIRNTLNITGLVLTVTAVFYCRGTRR